MLPSAITFTLLNIGYRRATVLRERQNFWVCFLVSLALIAKGGGLLGRWLLEVAHLSQATSLLAQGLVWSFWEKICLAVYSQSRVWWQGCHLTSHWNSSILPTRDGEPVWTQLNVCVNVNGGCEIIMDLKKCEWGEAGVQVSCKVICIFKGLGKVSSSAKTFDYKMLYWIE